MTAMNNQIQMAIETFDLDMVPGSVKALMKAIKATYEGSAEDQAVPGFQSMKGAGGSADLWKVPVKELKILPGFNVRLPGFELEEHIDFLAHSIKENGFWHTRPLAAVILEIDGVVGIYVFDGHCRLDGTNRAIAMGSDIEMLPVVVQDARRCNIDDLIVQLFCLNQGKKLTPFETGIVCKRLFNNGIAEATIAKRLGIKPQYVDGLLRLVNAPRALVEAVTTNEISASAAIQIIRTHGNGKVVAELEAMRARALVEAQAKVAAGDQEAASAVRQGRVHITPRHGAQANVKKVVTKHGLALFQLVRELQQDPAFAGLPEAKRLQLAELMMHLANAEKADTLPDSTVEETRQAA